MSHSTSTLIAKSQTPLVPTEIRDINIVFRATKTEQKLLDECCEGLVDRSTYMRAAIFGTPRSPVNRVGLNKSSPKSIANYSIRVKRIGNNINQLTKILHDRPNLRTTLDRYSTEITELKELLNRIHRELTNPQSTR